MPPRRNYDGSLRIFLVTANEFAKGSFLIWEGPPLVPAGTGGCAAGCNGNTYPQWYDPLGRYIFGGFTFTL